MRYFHKIFTISLFVIGILTTFYLWKIGSDYYILDRSERVLLETELVEMRSGGKVGHTYGIVGIGLISLNLLYLLRRNMKSFRRFGTLKTWMEFHVFAGLMGPILILFHTAFLTTNPIATIAAISLGTLVITGLVGRYIYAQVPRTATGEEINGSKNAQVILRWWRALHRYFAILMVITMIIHVLYAIYGGAKWIYGDG